MRGGKRITYRSTRPNPLFEDWLTTLLEEAREKNSKLIQMLEEAVSSITKYPQPLESGAECAILKGFDKRLCLFLDRRLNVYNSELKSVESLASSPDDSPRSHTEFINQNDSISESNTGEAKHLPNSNPILLTSNETIPDEHPPTKRPRCSQRKKNTGSDTCNNDNPVLLSPKPTKKPKGPKMYKPIYRTGGYAILIALLEHSKDNVKKPSLTKEQLIDRAQKYSEESFVRPKPESFYTAWSNMSNLIAKGLVVKSRQKKVEFTLTNQGSILAAELLKENENRPTVNDIIFNNVSSSDISNEVNNKAATASDTPVVIPKESTYTHESVIEMADNSFDIILLIDKNETGGVSKKNDPTVAQFKKYPDLKHEYRSLKVGDFTWVAKHKVNRDQELVLPYVIERKRMDDLGASIKDGRFHEQKFRLRKCGLDNIIYLVEQYGSNNHVGLPLHSLMQALANTRVQDGFKVHITDSLTNSVRFLAMMTKRLTIEFKDKNLKGCNRDSYGEQLMTFEYFTKSSAKTKPLTVTETFIKMLLQLKGVSVEKALAITKEYTTPRSLIKAYESCNVKEGQFLLANLKHGDLSRNVGPNISKAIYQFFSNIDGD